MPVWKVLYHICVSLISFISFVTFIVWFIVLVSCSLGLPLFPKDLFLCYSSLFPSSTLAFAFSLHPRSPFKPSPLPPPLGSLSWPSSRVLASAVSQFPSRHPSSTYQLWARHFGRNRQALANSVAVMGLLPACRSRGLLRAGRAGLRKVMQALGWGRQVVGAGRMREDGGWHGLNPKKDCEKEKKVQVE